MHNFKYYDFLQASFPEKTKNCLENILNEVRFWSNYPQHLPFLAISMTPKIIFQYLDYICHKSVELQRNLKHFNLGSIFTGQMLMPP